MSSSTAENQNEDQFNWEHTRLLVVEDDQVHRMIIRKLAVALDFDVVEAAGYDNAIKLLNGGIFDCISLDLSLGVHHGLEVLQYLVSAGRKMPILIVSGGNPASLKAVASYAEVHYVPILHTMKKPMDLAGLKARLAELKSLADLHRAKRKALLAPG